jgi:hypothetical protein
MTKTILELLVVVGLTVWRDILTRYKKRICQDIHSRNSTPVSPRELFLFHTRNHSGGNGMTSLRSQVAREP